MGLTINRIFSLSSVPYSQKHTGISSNGIPEYRVNLPLSWSYGKHRALLTGRWVSGISDYTESNGVVTLSTRTPTTGDYTTVDFRFSYEINDSMNMAFTAANIVNRVPERNGFTVANDLRRFGLQFNMEFGQ